MLCSQCVSGVTVSLWLPFVNEGGLRVMESPQCPRWKTPLQRLLADPVPVGLRVEVC